MKAKLIIWTLAILILIATASAYFESNGGISLGNDTRSYCDNSGLFATGCTNYTIGGYNYVYMKIETSSKTDSADWSNSVFGLQQGSSLNGGWSGNAMEVSLQCNPDYDNVTNVTLVTTIYTINENSDNTTTVVQKVDVHSWNDPSAISSLVTTQYSYYYTLSNRDFIKSELYIGYNGTINLTNLNTNIPMQFCEGFGSTPSFAHTFEKYPISQSVIDNINTILLQMNYQEASHNTTYSIFIILKLLSTTIIEIWYTAYWILKIAIVILALGLIFYLPYQIYKLIKYVVSK